jgi:hypothetical protein
VPTTSEVNGVDRTADVDRDATFLWVLRDVLGMTARSSAAAWRSAAPARSIWTVLRPAICRSGSSNCFD